MRTSSDTVDEILFGYLVNGFRFLFDELIYIHLLSWDNWKGYVVLILLSEMNIVFPSKF